MTPMQDDAASAGEIIKRYARACGGGALALITSEKRTGTLLRGQTGKVPFEITAMPPGRWLYHQTFAFGDQVCYGSEGARAWIQDTKGVQPMGERQRLDLQLLLAPEAPLRIAELYPGMEVVGSEEVDGEDAYTVLATSAGGVSTELAFDRQTGLLLRAGGMVFSDYREVDGVMRPFRIVLGRSDDDAHLQMTMEIAETRHGEPVDDSVFTMPAERLALADPPLYTPREEVAVSTDAMDACVGSYRHPVQEDVTYTVTRLRDHLMLHRTGWPVERELMPKSETEYFFRFPGVDFRFVRDQSGRITHLDVANGALKAARVE